MERPNWLVATARATALVVPMTITVILGFYVGNWLDEELGTSPLLLLLFGIGGLILGFYRMIIELNRRRGDGDDNGA